MKSIALLAATTMMSCSLALAQAQKPAAEAAKPAAQEAAKRAARPAKPAVSATSRARREEDARHCLGRPSTTEIIKCAEAYL